MSLPKYSEWHKLNERASWTRFTKTSVDTKEFLSMFAGKYSQHSQSGRVKNLKDVGIDELKQDLRMFYNIPDLETEVIGPGATAKNVPEQVKKGSYSDQYYTLEYKLDGEWYYLTLAGGSGSGGLKIKGEDFEGPICFAYNHFVLGMDRDAALKAAKYDAKDFETYEKFTIQTAMNVAKSFPKGLKPFVHTGKTSIKPINWESSDGTPKTDIYSGSERISLKLGGGSQLMSGTTESISVFNAALKYFEYHDRLILEESMKDIISGVKDKFVKLKVGKGIGKLKQDAVDAYVDFRKGQLIDIAKKAWPKETSTPKKLDDVVSKHAKAETIIAGIGDRQGNYMEWFIPGVATEDSEKAFNDWWFNSFLKNLPDDQRSVMEGVLSATLDHQFLEEKLRDIFTKSPEYLKWVVYEAATGTRKFTGQVEKLAHQVNDMPVANKVIVFDGNGITDEKEFTTEWAKSYTGHVKAVVGFKTANQTAMSSFRLLLEDNTYEETSYIDTIISEELEIFTKEIHKLNEGLGDVIGKIKSFAKNTMDNIAKAASDFWNKVIVRIVDKMRELLNKGIEFFASAFGIAKIEGRASIGINF